MITAAGREMTLRAWSDESGLEPNTITARMDRYGWTPEEAVGLEPRLPYKNKPYPLERRATLTVGGETKTIRDWAAEIGIREATLYQRVHSGWTPEQAVGRAPRKLRLRGAATTR